MDRIQVVVRASALHDPAAMERLKRGLLDGIANELSISVHEAREPKENDLTVIVVLTGGVEREVLKLASNLPSPVLLIAHGGHNSLPAALEVLARIRQDGGEGRILFGTPQQIAVELDREVRIADAWHRLRFSRVGLIGEPSDWLINSDVDRAFLRGRLGIELVSIPIDELVDRASSVRPNRSDVSRFAKEADATAEVSKGDLRRAVAVYEALRSLVDEHRLSACAVRCFDVVQRLCNTGCYALSRLNDEGVPSACEGDMQSLFGLYIARLLTGTTGFMGNIASVDAERNAVTVTHCSCPLSLASGYAIRSHFESGLGVGIQARVASGPCTLFRFGGERLGHLFLREGTLRDAPLCDDLCRTQLVAVADGPLNELLIAPLGNHHIVLPGRHGATIRLFFDRYFRAGLPLH